MRFVKFTLFVLASLIAMLPSKAATVTIDYADDLAHEALLMIFNVTQFRSVKGDVFEVEDGDVIRMSLNTFDYDVTVDGTAVAPEANKNYSTWLSQPITSDITITISATPREFGSTSVVISVLDPEGIVLREGDPNGPVIDISSIEPAMSDGMYVYRVPVSLKSPKVFVYAAPGYWIKESFVGEGRDKVYTIMSTNDGNVLFVYDYKLNADNKIVYRIMCGTTGSFVGSADNALLVDAHGSKFSAEEGYNVYDVDINYVSPLTVRPMNVPDVEENSAFSIYLNGAPVSIDKDYSTFIMDVNGNSVIYAFVGRQPAAKRTITIEKPEDDTATSIVYDKIVDVDKSTSSFKVFNTAEVTVTPKEGYDVLLDDNKLELVDGSVSFSADKNYTLKIVEANTSSILSVCSEKDNFTVVSLDGVVILKNASKDQIDTLPSGFYIINGKKVMK